MGEIWGRNGRETAVAEWRWTQLPPGSEPAGRYPVAEGDPDSVENTGVPLPRFALLLLVPTAVDHFQLAGFPQRRAIYTLRDAEDAPSLLGPDAWQRTRVSP